jgi:hypothetical protein
MAENSPVRRVRPSHRKQPYENPTKAAPSLLPASTALISGRAPLRNIQSAITAPLLQNKKMGANFSSKMEVVVETAPVVPPPPENKPEFGVIGGEKRLRRENSLGFIPVEKSCIIGGDEMHASANNSLNMSSGSMDQDLVATGWNPFSSFHVTSGILGAVQNNYYYYITRIIIKLFNLITAPAPWS